MNFISLKSMSWRVLLAMILAGSICPGVGLEAAAQSKAASVTAGTLIKGAVFDSQGEPLIGATVLEKGTSNGVATDLDGNFTLKLTKADAKLVVSYVGFDTMEISAASADISHIVLKENSSVLDEVVVVGYGTQKKATMTGAVTVVGEKQLEDKGSLASPVQAMQGQVPGVIITRSNSAPGEEGWNMKIRGSVSKNNSDPLVIIDGVEYEGVGALNQINPSDIETMNILKDAAASIYGSKAAGGVVLITTKKGVSGKAKVDYNGSFTGKFIGNRAQQMGLVDWATAQIEAYRNDGYDDSYDRIKWCKMMIEFKDRYLDFRHTANPISMFSDCVDLTFFDTDWQDIMWGNSWSTSHDLAVSGGKDGNTYRVSAAYMYDDSNLKWGKNHNNRFNVRLTNSFKFNDHFSLNSSIAVNRQDQVAPTQIGAALTSCNMQPGFPSSTKDGKPYGWGSNWRSPNWLCELGGENRYQAVSVNVSEAFRYTIIEGLNINATFGYNYRGNTRDKQEKAVDFYNYAGDMKVFTLPLDKDTYYEKWWDRRELFTAQGYVDWNKTFNQDHNLKLMAGVQYSFTDYESNTNTAKNIIPSLEIINGTGEITTKASKWQEALLSYYGRVNYDYKYKYLLEAQARYDGSSKFQAANRWAFFWGVSAGWRITEEAFMEGARSGSTNSSSALPTVTWVTRAVSTATRA